jgi:hypothetical protein
MNIRMLWATIASISYCKISDGSMTMGRVDQLLHLLMLFYVQSVC